MKVTHQTIIPENTCHPGSNVEFHTQEKPFPTWNCSICGKVLSVDKNPPKLTAN